MTEEQWLAGTDLPGMLDTSMDKLKDVYSWLDFGRRKAFLFCLAMNRYGRYDHDQLQQKLAALIEPVADGLVAASVLLKRREYADYHHSIGHPIGWAYNLCSRPLSQEAAMARLAIFRAVAFESAWRTPLVMTIATACYEERLDNGVLDPARLLVLSDALEDAGCASQEILAPLRPQPHAILPSGAVFERRGHYLHLLVPKYRGFWVLDRVLGKHP